MKSHFFELYKLFVERYFRVRTLGTVLLKGGLGLLIVVLAADIAGQLDLRFGDFKLNIQGGTGSGLPKYIG